MNNTLKKFFLRDISQWYFWVLFALIVKGILFFLAVHIQLQSVDATSISGFWGSTWGDTSTYILPVDNLVSKGIYTPDFRMPGLAFLYYPLALILPKTAALNAFIIAQFILDAIAVYCLALSAKYIFKKDSLFYLTFYIYAFSTFSSLFNTVLLSESLTTSSLIFSVFFFARFLEKEKTSALFWSGLFMAWTIFLRPASLPLLAFLALALFIKQRKIVSCLILLLPFVIMDGAWIIRNYRLNNNIKPLTKSVHYFAEDSYKNGLYTFCQAWGGFRAPGFEWFFSRKYTDADGSKVIPQEIFTSQFNMDSLVHLRSLIFKISDSTGKPGFNDNKYNAIAYNCFERYTQSVKKEHPYLYYVEANEIRLINFFRVSYFSILFFNKLTSTYCIYTYYAVLLLGFLGSLLLIWHWRQNAMALLFVSIPVYTFALYCIVFRADENRYFVPAFPFLVVCSAFAINYICQRFFKKSGA